MDNTMSKAGYARIAEEARKLAFECVEGTAPQFDPFSYYDCALGVVAVRSRQFGADCPGEKLSEVRGLQRAALLVEFSIFPRDTLAKYPGLTPHESAVFPLMALADEAEALAR